MDLDLIKPLRLQSHIGDEQSVNGYGVAGRRHGDGPSQDAVWPSETSNLIGKLNPPELARLGRLYLLSDGVSGCADGAAASQLAVQTAGAAYYDLALKSDKDPAGNLKEAILKAHSALARWDEQFFCPRADKHPDGQPRLFAKYNLSFVSPPLCPLCGGMLAGLQATLVALLLHNQADYVAYVGDSWAYHIRPTARAPLFQPVRDQFLGMPSFDETMLHIQAVTLAPGERILLFSDGLTDVLKARFGEQRWDEELADEALLKVQSYVANLDAWRANLSQRDLQDDITLISVNVAPRVNYRHDSTTPAVTDSPRPSYTPPTLSLSPTLSPSPIAMLFRGALSFNDATIREQVSRLDDSKNHDFIRAWAAMGRLEKLVFADATAKFIRVWAAMGLLEKLVFADATATDERSELLNLRPAQHGETIVEPVRRTREELGPLPRLNNLVRYARLRLPATNLGPDAGQATPHNLYQALAADLGLPAQEPFQAFQKDQVGEAARLAWRPPVSAPAVPRFAYAACLLCLAERVSACSIPKKTWKQLQDGDLDNVPVSSDSVQNAWTAGTLAEVFELVATCHKILEQARAYTPTDGYREQARQQQQELHEQSNRFNLFDDDQEYPLLPKDDVALCRLTRDLCTLRAGWGDKPNVEPPTTEALQILAGWPEPKTPLTLLDEIRGPAINAYGLAFWQAVLKEPPKDFTAGVNIGLTADVKPTFQQWLASARAYFHATDAVERIAILARVPLPAYVSPRLTSLLDQTARDRLNQALRHKSIETAFELYSRLRSEPGNKLASALVTTALRQAWTSLSGNLQAQDSTAPSVRSNRSTSPDNANDALYNLLYDLIDIGRSKHNILTLTHGVLNIDLSDKLDSDSRAGLQQLQEKLLTQSWDGLQRLPEADIQLVVSSLWSAKAALSPHIGEEWQEIMQVLTSWMGEGKKEAPSWPGGKVSPTQIERTWRLYQYINPVGPAPRTNPRLRAVYAAWFDKVWDEVLVANAIRVQRPDDKTGTERLKPFRAFFKSHNVVSQSPDADSLAWELLNTLIALNESMGKDRRDRLIATVARALGTPTITPEIASKGRQFLRLLLTYQQLEKGGEQ